MPSVTNPRDTAMQRKPPCFIQHPMQFRNKERVRGYAGWRGEGQHLRN